MRSKQASSGRALRCTKLAASTGRTEGSSDRLPFSRSVVVTTELSTELLGAGVRESSYWSQSTIHSAYLFNYGFN